MLRFPARQRGHDARCRAGSGRIGAALVVAALLVASALMARVSDAVAVAGFGLAVLLGVYMIWKTIRTPGEL